MHLYPHPFSKIMQSVKPNTITHRLAQYRPLIIMTMLSFMLTQCSLSDPEYATLLTRAEAAPQANAIVGMWHRKDPKPTMGYQGFHSILFQSGGTGYTRYFVNNTTPYEWELPITWSYDGSGVWAVMWKMTTCKCRLSGDQILIEHSLSWNNWPYQRIFTRAK